MILPWYVDYALIGIITIAVCAWWNTVRGRRSGLHHKATWMIIPLWPLFWALCIYMFSRGFLAGIARSR